MWHQARPSTSGSLPRRNLQTYQGDQQWGWSLGGCCPSSCPTTGLWCARDPCKILATALDLAFGTSSLLHRLLGLHCEPGCGGTVSGAAMSKRGVFVKDLSQTCSSEELSG